MYKKIVFIFSVLVIITLIIWFYPTKISDVKLSEVTKINIFNGNTGKDINITNEKDIEHMITNLNQLKLKKSGISFGIMGYTYKITIYKKNNISYKEFIINSENEIRKDPFFYKDKNSSIDFDYISNLMH